MALPRKTVRQLRPMRVLLATDEATYADDVYAAADELGVDVTAMSTENDIETTALRIGANVVVFDAGDDFAPTARAAAAFAAVHPDVVVCVVATGVDDHLNDGRAGAVLVVHRWRSPERLLDRLSSAYLGLRAATESRSSVGP
jgi:DNA-binding response OmpR family regulator